MSHLTPTRTRESFENMQDLTPHNYRIEKFKPKLWDLPPLAEDESTVASIIEYLLLKKEEFAKDLEKQEKQLAEEFKASKDERILVNKNNGDRDTLARSLKMKTKYETTEEGQCRIQNQIKELRELNVEGRKQLGKLALEIEKKGKALAVCRKSIEEDNAKAAETIAS